MFRHSRELWPWAPLSFRDIDHDMGRLMDVLWTSNAVSYCDSNGVLTVTPTYRVDVRQSSDEAKNKGMTIEVDIPGVKKEAVALEAHGNRLKVVAAKYSPDRRSGWCKRRKKKGETEDAEKAKEKEKEEKEKEKEKILPSIVYKLHLRISSRADIEQAQASYRGDGVLQVTIPYKKEDVKKIAISIGD